MEIRIDERGFVVRRWPFVTVKVVSFGDLGDTFLPVPEGAK